ncbi:methyltransferase domain-containing protein [Paenibacillus roseipurpureus]|uniref:Methyltransferase domain-containing protein n=1 Tax=Paenibacillus roseopurpureus TaxID=2918901 RepID=A0AA96LMI0_9BACL|nr:methyltransferase domain-containing protein [Paenibacillus sp. MBLB1832]WNR43876.1 methyltransferase domain-containing protein [Paenibacillus sp. MBLB1832]
MSANGNSKNLENTGERFIPGLFDMLTSDEHWQRYISVSAFVENKVVLDIASGEGYGSNYIAQTANKVFGVDISEEAIEHAQQKYNRENLCFSVGSVDKLGFEKDFFDTIVSFETIEHVGQDVQEKFLTEVKRVLKQDGVFIVSCPNKAIASDLAFDLWGYSNEFHLKEYYLDEFKEFLSNYFENVQFLYQRSEIAIILNDFDADSLKILRMAEKDHSDVQNIIAVCSQNEIDVSSMNSIVLDNRHRYLDNNKNVSGLIKSNTNLQGSLNSTLEVFMQTDQKLHDANLDLLQKEQQLSMAHSQLEQKDQLIENIKDQLKQKDYQLSVTSSKLHQMERQLSDSEAHMKKLEKQFEQKDVEIQVILNSTSWKFTKPLRRLESIFRKLRKDSE